MFPIEASEKIFAECLWLNFSKVTGEISALRKLFHVRWYIQKSSILEIGRNSPLTKVAPLQSTGCNPTKNQLLTKFFDIF